MWIRLLLRGSSRQQEASIMYVKYYTILRYIYFFICLFNYFFLFMLLDFWILEYDDKVLIMKKAFANNLNVPVFMKEFNNHCTCTCSYVYVIEFWLYLINLIRYNLSENLFTSISALQQYMWHNRLNVVKVNANLWEG